MWYKPNVKNNNALRDRAVKRITAFMNKIWNGEITSVSYNHKTILSIMDEMMESAKALSVVDAKGTENVYPVYYRLNVLIDILEKSVELPNLFPVEVKLMNLSAFDIQNRHIKVVSLSACKRNV